jgi:predicted nucleotidyltransferase
MKGKLVVNQKDVKKILLEFKEYLKEILQSKFVELILYGSYARGDYEFGSDVDVLLLVKEKLTKKEKDSISIKASELSLKYDIVISCFTYLYQAYKTWETPFLMNVRSEGIKI